MLKHYGELKAILKNAAQHGADCYIYADEQGNYLWGFILTPGKNILYIQRDIYDTGWEFCLKYVPSHSNGQGCQCLKEPIPEVSWEDIQAAEREGLRFAQKLGATLYLDTAQALKKMWRFEEMEHIT